MAASRHTTLLCTRCLGGAALRPQQPSTLRRLSSCARLQSSGSSPRPPLRNLMGRPPPLPLKPQSICLEGTILTGLNYTKGGKDPVAMKDEDYPDWLWSCLDVTQKNGSDEDALADADEFSKSKKQRRLHAKLQKAKEAFRMASGDPNAFAPPVPLQHQSINLPGAEGGSVQDNIAAEEARTELGRAMRKERKAKIKETNYLKSM